MAKVIVGLSGGVDSAVAALLLKKAGHQVVGLTLRTSMEENRCCEIDDARAVAKALGIEFRVLNVSEQFSEKVIAPFVGSYCGGRTPNPCVGCNRTIKWEWMLYEAQVLGADFVATGHYANIVRLPSGRFTVKTADRARKDQTYMLYQLTQEQLSRTLMPLGGYSKDEVRKRAEAAGLPVAEKPDSQEICFVPDGRYAEYIKEYLAAQGAEHSGCGAEVPVGGRAGCCADDMAGGRAAGFAPGDFVDLSGKVLGQHKGIINYTVGQRKGLGIALGAPAYVVRIDTEKNRVVLGTDADLWTREVLCGDVRYMAVPELKPGETLKVRAKVRYQHDSAEAELTALEGGRAKLLFAEPVRAAAPGQAAVFYDADGCVAGGGIIG